MDDDLRSIGRFARLAGLSVGALRHYDELDLLRPADIDRFTGYRRYRRAQLVIGAGLQVAVDETHGRIALDPVLAALTVAVPVSIYLLAVGTLHASEASRTTFATIGAGVALGPRDRVRDAAARAVAGSPGDGPRGRRPDRVRPDPRRAAGAAARPCPGAIRERGPGAVESGFTARTRGPARRIR